MRLGERGAITICVVKPLLRAIVAQGAAGRMDVYFDLPGVRRMMRRYAAVSDATLRPAAEAVSGTEVPTFAVASSHADRS